MINSYKFTDVVVELQIRVYRFDCFMLDIVGMILPLPLVFMSFDPFDRRKTLLVSFRIEPPKRRRLPAEVVAEKEVLGNLDN